MVDLAFDLGMKSTDAFLREYADAEGPFFLRDFAMAEEACYPNPNPNPTPNPNPNPNPKPNPNPNPNQVPFVLFELPGLQALPSHTP